eukprot:jgi/Bigna1/90330/estExt_fgenesh1_pg.C_670084
MAPFGAGAGSSLSISWFFEHYWPLVSLLLSIGFTIFFTDLSVLALQAYRLFLPRFARAHRVLGAIYLALLLFGFADLHSNILPRFIFDVLLGVTGIFLTLSAAWGFPHHRRVTNEASGTLDEDATVTYDEMIEHSFYQGLNLAQIIYIHLVPEVIQNCVSTMSPSISGKAARISIALLVTLPWLVRSYFPVNRFSDNYAKLSAKKPSNAAAGALDWIIPHLYRLKKYQYIFYKHFLLHGLNVSIALKDWIVGVRSLATQEYFKWYWLGLNTAYVMEFFLQTLVKRKRLSQTHMLGMQQLLMIVCTMAALPVLSNVRIPLALLSLVLNFVQRGHEMRNICTVLLFGSIIDYFAS